MMTEPLGDKVKFSDRSRGYCDRKSPQHGLEVYWAGLLERVKRESETISSKGEAPQKALPPRQERREENEQASNYGLGRL
jgi:hypothetical protein